MSKSKIKLKKSNKKPKLNISENDEYHEMLTFNFSYISNDKNFDFKHCNKKNKVALLDKIIRLSAINKIKLLALPKKSGLENLSDDTVSFRINNEFIQSRFNICEDGYWVFRFHSRDCRCIGKVNKNVFYVLCIDTKLKSYNHGK